MRQGECALVGALGTVPGLWEEEMLMVFVHVLMSIGGRWGWEAAASCC